MNISKAIEGYLIASNEKEESTKARKYYISDMGKCHRMRFLKRKGIRTSLEPYVYWIFAIGDMFHEFGYKALEAQSLLLQTEQALEADEHWSGRYDGLVKNELGTPSVFDFKSSGGYAMKKAIAGADNEENIEQILTYILFERKRIPNLSNTGILVYMNKEPNDVVPLPAFDREYHLTNTREKKITEQMQRLVNYWVDDTIPDCTCPAWMKNYNSFLPFCQMDEKNIRKYLALLDDKTIVISTKKAIFTEVIGDKASRTEITHL